MRLYVAANTDKILERYCNRVCKLVLRPSGEYGFKKKCRKISNPSNKYLLNTNACNTNHFLVYRNKIYLPQLPKQLCGVQTGTLEVNEFQKSVCCRSHVHSLFVTPLRISVNVIPYRVFKCTQKS